MSLTNIFFPTRYLEINHTTTNLCSHFKGLNTSHILQANTVRCAVKQIYAKPIRELNKE